MKPYFEDEHVKIYHGDSRELLPMMPKVDLVLTDPPYGIDVGRHPQSGNRGNRAIKDNGYDTFKVYDDLWNDAPIDQPMFDQLISFAPKAIIWGGNYYATPRASGWLVWDKVVNPGLCAAHCELAYTTLPIAVRQFTYLWVGYWQEPGFNRQVKEHLTQKPIALMKWCIGLAKDAQTVIDPYMGSGTTLRAAKDLGIKAIGIEIEERYCEIAARRMAQQVLTFEPAPEQATAAGMFE